jgi:hypothetical protein
MRAPTCCSLPAVSSSECYRPRLSRRTWFRRPALETCACMRCCPLRLATADLGTAGLSDLFTFGGTGDRGEDRTDFFAPPVFRGLGDGARLRVGAGGELFAFSRSSCFWKRASTRSNSSTFRAVRLLSVSSSRPVRRGCALRCWRFTRSRYLSRSVRARTIFALRRAGLSSRILSGRLASTSAHSVTVLNALASRVVIGIPHHIAHAARSKAGSTACRRRAPSRPRG